MYTDSHCHLTCDELYDQLDEVLANMHSLSSCMIMCTNETEFQRALLIKKQDPRFKVAFGFFPGDAKEVSHQDLEQLEMNLKEGLIDVLGEIGLDYYWDDSFKEIQKELFIKQIELANRYKVPISIHMREATNDCLSILKQYAKTKIILDRKSTRLNSSHDN